MWETRLDLYILCLPLNRQSGKQIWKQIWRISSPLFGNDGYAHRGRTWRSSSWRASKDERNGWWNYHRKHRGGYDKQKRERSGSAYTGICGKTENFHKRLKEFWKGNRKRYSSGNIFIFRINRLINQERIWCFTGLIKSLSVKKDTQKYGNADGRNILCRNAPEKAFPYF